MAGQSDSDLWPDIYGGDNLTFGQDQIYENQAGVGYLDVVGNSPGVGDDSPSAMGITISVPE